MVVIEKVEYSRGYIFKFKMKEGVFSISFKDNDGLYWNYESSNIKDDVLKKDFLITKENYFLYSLFEELYNSIWDQAFEYQFFDEDENIYKNGMIDYHSDDYFYEEASSFQIEELEDSYKLSFIKGKVNNNIMTYAVRLTMNASRYRFFFNYFMNMYESLINYEPNNHQIHLEEYMYNLKRVRKKETA